MFNQGDKLLCKKSLKEEGSLFRYTFRKGKRYEVKWKYEYHINGVINVSLTEYLFDLGKSKPVSTINGWIFVTPENMNGFITSRPQLWFYTKQEERMLKLKKIIKIK